MKGMRTLWLAGVMVIGLMLTANTRADDRTAEDILTDIDNVQMPRYDAMQKDEEGYIESFQEARAKAMAQQAAFILELYEKYPDHERVIDLLPRRWYILMGNDEYADVIDAEFDQIIEDSADATLVAEARYCKAMKSVQTHLWPMEEEDRDMPAAMRDIDAFLTALPDDERGARLLNYLANAYETGSDDQIAVYKRIKHQYPDSTGAKYVDGKIRQAMSVGKPFELTFEDAITGTRIDMKELRGQVVVIDFWATWCGPCVGEMPHMKELYAKYRGQGVQFIGVSLDQPKENGGLTRLKNFVEENEIRWPQYFQGKGWDGEFSVSWGINSIPCLFIVDKEGNLHSTTARGKLEEMIPELLAK